MSDPTPRASDGWLVRNRTWFLAALGALLYLPFLHLRDMWYPDEPDIAEVCRAMFLSGDWIAPRRMGVIWVDYPPMLYWAGAAFAHLFGRASEVALRLPNALTGIATVLVTCRVGSRWFGPRAGLWAGFSLLTMLQFAYQAVSYRPDVLFTVWILLGIVLYAEGASGRPRLGLRVAGFAMLGLAMLAKGPLGLLLPGLVLVLWNGARRRWVAVLELAPLALVALAVYLPWFVACARAMGSDSILYELYAQNVARFFSGDRGHGQPVYYYLVNFWLDLLPWSFLFPAAVWWHLRTRRTTDPRIRLLLWWIAAFVAFLTVAVTKRQLYLLPAYPAVALLLGPWLAAVGRAGERGPSDAPSPRAVRAYGAGMAALLALVGILLIGAAAGADAIVERAGLNEQEIEVARGVRVPLVVLGVVLLGGAAALARAWRRRDGRAVLVATGASFVVVYLVVLGLVLPRFGPTKTYKPQSLWIVERIGDEPAFGLVNPYFGGRKMGAFGYETGRMVVLLDHGDEVDAFLREHPGSVVLIEEDAADAIFASDEAGWRARVERPLRTGSQLYFVVGPPDDAVAEPDGGGGP